MQKRLHEIILSLLLAAWCLLGERECLVKAGLEEDVKRSGRRAKKGFEKRAPFLFSFGGLSLQNAPDIIIVPTPPPPLKRRKKWANFQGFTSRFKKEGAAVIQINNVRKGVP